MIWFLVLFKFVYLLIQFVGIGPLIRQFNFGLLGKWPELVILISQGKIYQLSGGFSVFSL